MRLWNKKKEKIPKVGKTIRDVFPYVDLQDGYVEMNDGLIGIYQMGSKDVYSLNEDEVNRHVFEFARYLRSNSQDIKIMSMNFPVLTTTQQEYIKRKLEKCTHERYKKFLQAKLVELEFLESDRMNREYFVFLYGKTKESVEEQLMLLRQSMRSTQKIYEISDEKKVRLLYKLYNQNAPLT